MLAYDSAGYCPICCAATQFESEYHWFRDHLFCKRCGSVPRERALALVLEREYPEWRDLLIHESSPTPRGISVKMASECKNYTSTQFFPKEPLGKVVQGFRNENLESTKFGDESFDLVISLDVMEHVNRPEKVFVDVARTLKARGAYVFTVPTYKDKVKSQRRAMYMEHGISYYAEPEYHGNPISDKGSLVTFHYGYDLAELIFEWSGLNVEVRRFHDHKHGIIGDFTEVYIARK